jgi:glyoxylase-like metal-dependent hydrolase (beta-lactamase superfamily II)
LLSGPGGNVAVLKGPDGKILVDTFLLPAWPNLKRTLDALGNAPLMTVIDTHWHFDHTDNNAHLHAAGATVLAHENTKARMAEPHDSAALGLHIPPSPADALPQQTFSNSKILHANGEIPISTFIFTSPTSFTWATLFSTALTRSSTPVPAEKSTG